MDRDTKKTSYHKIFKSRLCKSKTNSKKMFVRLLVTNFFKQNSSIINIETGVFFGFDAKTVEYIEKVVITKLVGLVFRNPVHS